VVVGKAISETAAPSETALQNFYNLHLDRRNMFDYGIGYSHQNNEISVSHYRGRSLNVLDNTG
jgi:hypothetical protein